jgi:hypothetical protein
MRSGKRQTLGQPAPFTAEQVAALTAGKANLSAVAKLLKAHSQHRLSTRPQKEKKRAPIPMTQSQLRELASGSEMPSSVTAALEKSSPPSEKPRKRRAMPRQSGKPDLPLGKKERSTYSS